MCAKKWSCLFKKHLMNHVVDSLAELEHFIDQAEIGLQAQVSEGDYDGLVKMMGYLKSVKENQYKVGRTYLHQIL